MKTSMRFLLILCLALGFVIYWQRARNHELQAEAQAAHQDADDARQAARQATEAARKAVAAAEADTAKARADLAGANKKIDDLLEQAKGDTQFRVTKTEYIEGQLVPSGQTNPDTGKPILKRVDARWLVYVQGVQTKKDYPPIEVTSAAFSEFTQGAVYNRQAINDAKR